MQGSQLLDPCADAGPSDFDLKGISERRAPNDPEEGPRDEAQVGESRGCGAVPVISAKTGFPADREIQKAHAVWDSIRPPRVGG